MPPSAEDAARASFTARFDTDPEGVAVAPGRVNLIGDHTDYNDGFVLPMAIDRSLAIAFRSRSDGTVHVVSGDETAEFALDPPSHGVPPWSEYLRGVAWAHASAASSAGWDGVIASTIPAGASLSSSAAIEVATALVFDHLAGEQTDRTELALAAQRAEREWVGMECGIMDQLSVAASTEGHALLIDCRSLTTEDVPIPDYVVAVVLDTSTRRQLTESPYNDRRAACERVAAQLGVAALRDLDAATLTTRWDELDPVDGRRARHVLSENQRVLEAAAALRSGDIDTVGRLMTESHRSLRDDFESSSPALDAMVEAALDSPGCFGARVTGAGFAGCAVALVEAVQTDAFIAATTDRYTAATGLTPELYPCRPSGSAFVTD